MLKNKTLTYISLFSCAGVGCYGFKKAGFECIATNELIERRLKVQTFNNKCMFDSGYICEDITKESTKQLIFDEIKRWEKLGNDKVDVLIATPPCQGMSVANHKKAENEIERNSLVVESIHLVQRIKPRFFIFENVAAFMKTGCTAPDGTVKAIGDVVYEELSDEYIITSRILNFKNYGSNSSRTRTVVIGVSKSLSEFVAPIELYPLYRDEKTLNNIIGDMPKLSWGEICENDFYHAFRSYPDEMRCWIHELKEGQSAFDNEEESKRPHKIVNGNIVINKQKNGDKYTRQYWHKVAPCIHTRNDQLASQSTVHPSEDRVFSISELMKLMTIPENFKWVEYSLEQLNVLSDRDKQKLLKKEEIKIRQSIGEAVPTNIFYQIASNIANFLDQTHYSSAQISKVITEYNLLEKDKLLEFIEKNPLNCGSASLARIAELVNSQRENNAAYYTNKFIINEIYKELPEFEKNEINILEPSVGIGNFLPFIFRKYEGTVKVNLDVVDIDMNNLKILKTILKRQHIPDNFKINFINDDFLLHQFNKKYDLVIGNPPFSKLKVEEAKVYLKNNFNKETTNTFEFFLEKAMKIGSYVAMITPKALLNTPEFVQTRNLLNYERVACIEDFGELGFKGVLVETICIFIRMQEQPEFTKVISLPLQKILKQKQSYIMDSLFPYWLIYRDDFFDRIAKRLEFNKFSVFRDRQITNSNTTNNEKGAIRVLKSRNISDDGKEILDIPGYDAYIDQKKLKSLSAFKFVNDKSVYLTPNMTYKPRVIKNVSNTIVNGSVAVLIPKEELNLTEQQLAYFSSDEYRKFYKIARNYQTRSLNVDATSVFFYGVLREKING
jgi:DNA (cytosine-5)-methyltransferase 1